MDKIKQWLTNPIVMLVIGLVVGAIFGLVVLGWWLFPVQWTDAAAEDLRYDVKIEVMRTCIDAFGYNGDAAKAKACYDSLGDDAGPILTEIVQNPGIQDPKLITTFGTIAIAEAPAGVPEGEVVVGTIPVDAGTVMPTMSPDESSKGSSYTFLLVLCLVVLLCMAAFFILFYVRRRQSASKISTPPIEDESSTTGQATDRVEYAASGGQTPMAQFIASYKLGDDSFDESYTIDSPSGEFLGECGVGISETIGVGEPKRVSAFEVWLFDKNDIQTVTKVLMSNHIFSDPNSRQRLAARGEPVLVDLGMETLLQTSSFRLVVRVIDMKYGEGAMPSESYFDSFSLEMVIWQM